MTEERLSLNVFGREMQVLRSSDCWTLYYIGNEGKRRRALDIAVEEGLDSEQLIQYLADLLHENA